MKLFKIHLIKRNNDSMRRKYSIQIVTQRQKERLKRKLRQRRLRSRKKSGGRRSWSCSYNVVATEAAENTRHVSEMEIEAQRIMVEEAAEGARLAAELEAKNEKKSALQLKLQQWSVRRQRRRASSKGKRMRDKS